MFLPMAYDERNSVNMLLWLWFIVTFASVLGAMVGHTLGRLYGTKLLDRFGKPHHRERLEFLFERYGTWGMFIAAVSPLPYKVFGWIAGASDMKMRPFVIAGIFGRGFDSAWKRFSSISMEMRRWMQQHGCSTMNSSWLLF